MPKTTKIHLLTVLSLIIITPLGFLSKFYTGFGQKWFNDYAGDILYEIFWCLIFFLLIPRRQAVRQIPIGVFIVTCILEFMQLWHPPFLEQIRANFWGRTLIGTTFVWWDFPHYIIGCLIGWLWLRQIWLFKQRNQNEKTS